MTVDEIRQLFPGLKENLLEPLQLFDRHSFSFLNWTDKHGNYVIT